MSAAGANVTTLDNSPAQLQRDQLVARREGLEIATVLGQMDDLSDFHDQAFDLIVHPCSNCFCPADPSRLARGVFESYERVVTCLSGFNNPVRYLFDSCEMQKGNLVVKTWNPVF